MSGNDFDLTPGVEANDAIIPMQGCYVLSLCSLSFSEFNVCATRTMLVDPTDEQSNAYDVAHDVLQVVVDAIRPGQKLKDIYILARTTVEKKNPDLVDYFSEKIGVVTKVDLMDEQMVISEKSETIVIPGMSFYVNPGFKTTTWAVCIGETCFLPLEENKRCELLTAKVTTERALISYTLDDPNGVPDPAPTQSAGSTRFGSVSFGPWSFDNSLTYLPSSLFCFPLKSNSGLSPVPVSIYRSQSAFGFHLFLVW
jgi:nucleosome binding factor SPN SPT16 subunit